MINKIKCYFKEKPEHIYDVIVIFFALLLTYYLVTLRIKVGIIYWDVYLYLNNALNNLVLQVENYFECVSKLNEQITSIYANYHQNINVVIEEAKNKGIDFIENIKNEINTSIQNKVSSNEQLYNDRCLEVKNISESIEKEFVEREQQIKVTEEQQQAEYLKDYEQILKKPSIFGLNCVTAN